MEERIARLEAHTSHLQEDVRRIDQKIDALAEKLDTLKDAVANKFDELTSALNAFKLETTKARWADRVWWLLISAALLGVMARGFKWV
jgi:predicted nuclease with TOPRIM domain